MQLNLLTCPERQADAEMVTVPRVEYEALRQFYETHIGVRVSYTESDVYKAIAAHNEAERALWQLQTPQEKWRTRIEIVPPQS
ncbi:hypothetical protein LMK08_16730 [Metapseudomonas furukawaii]|uniref:hypothetical protein n=1 Tax=Metapseudomonas furukawaii TaxID=1149133 RepID=UPI00227BC052|nr:hypothetical protein [Pseudomonas furukawaii]WAG77021.1 hypothetical protein LMK08_16730 [Pseudomonas furukawaii]